MLTGGNPSSWYVTKVTSAARQAVGQWPTAEGFIDRLAEAFGEAAEREQDSKRRGRLREIANMFTGFGRDIAVDVAARIIERQSGIG